MPGVAAAAASNVIVVGSIVAESSVAVVGAVPARAADAVAPAHVDVVVIVAVAVVAPVDVAAEVADVEGCCFESSFHTLALNRARHSDQDSSQVGCDHGMMAMG